MHNIASSCSFISATYSDAVCSKNRMFAVGKTNKETTTGSADTSDRKTYGMLEASSRFRAPGPAQMNRSYEAGTNFQATLSIRGFGGVGAGGRHRFGMSALFGQLLRSNYCLRPAKDYFYKHDPGKPHTSNVGMC